MTGAINSVAPKLTPKLVTFPESLPSYLGIPSLVTPFHERSNAPLRYGQRNVCQLLTNLFDESYLPKTKDKDSPFISPATVSDETLVGGLPENITIYLCERDMRLDEDRKFGECLRRFGKNVDCTMIEEAKHALKKMPAFRLDPKAQHLYLEACAIINGVLTGSGRPAVSNCSEPS